MADTTTFRLAAQVMLILFAGWSAGCTTAGNQAGPAPQIRDPAAAGTLTLSRDGSLVGLFAPMQININNYDRYRLARNQRLTLILDPGDYLLKYAIGLNQCSQVIHLTPRQTRHLRLVANCMVYEE